MPIDWDAIDEELKTAAKQTSDDLAGRISSLTRLTDEEVKQLFPKSADAARLVELMRIVRDDTTQMKKVNQLVTNIERLGGVVITLLTKLA